VFFVLLSVLLLVCIPCAAGASDNIKIFVNGQQVFSDVPPQAIDGRTMVPIRVVSEALGAQVTWNDNTKSVEITNNTVITESEVADNDVDDSAMLKLYLKIANHYYELGKLNDQLVDISRDLYYTRYYGQTRVTWDEISDKLDNIRRSLKSIREDNQRLLNEANKAGLDITDTRDILLKYEQAISLYKKAKNGLNTADNNNMGFKESIDSAQKAFNGYNRFSKLIQDF